MNEFPKNTFLGIKPKHLQHHNYQDNPKCISFPIFSTETEERWTCQYKKGFELDSHRHRGRYELVIISGMVQYNHPELNKFCILEKGDYYYCAPNVLHNLLALEDTEVFWIYTK